MAWTVYPEAHHLQRFLESAGLTVGTVDLRGAIRAGIDSVEHDTDRHFLAGKSIENEVLGDEGVETRYFDPPVGQRGIIDLQEDLAVLESLTVQTAAKLENTDFWLRAEGNHYNGPPFVRVEFRYPFYYLSPLSVNLRRAVAISGKWGYGLTIPDEVFDAMLAASALRVFPRLVAATFGGLSSYREGDVSETFGEKPLESTRAAWEMQVKDIALKHKRVAVG